MPQYANALLETLPPFITSNALLCAFVAGMFLIFRSVKADRAKTDASPIDLGTAA